MNARLLVALMFGASPWAIPAISSGECPCLRVTSDVPATPGIAKNSCPQEQNVLHSLSAKGGAHVVVSYSNDDGSSVVTLREHMASDDVVALLTCVPGLKWLTITPPQPSRVTDASAVHLRELTNLEGLNLCATGVTSSGLRHLSALSQLKSLSLGSRVDDLGMPHLAGLELLEYLDLNSTQISDAGLPAIGKLCCLRTLNLSNTHVTNRGIHTLQSLMNLEFLNLSDCGDVNAAVLSELGGEIEPELMCMLKTSRLKMLSLPEAVRLNARDVENLVRLMGMSRLEKFASESIPNHLEPDLLNWRDEIERWRKLGAYVEFDTPIDLERDTPRDKIVGLYFLAATPQKRPDDFTLGFLPPNLMWLSLRDQPITDAGLGIIAAGGYAALEQINLYGCASVTSAGVEKLDNVATLPKLSTIFVDDRLGDAPYFLRDEPPLEVKPLAPDYKCPQCCPESTEPERQSEKYLTLTWTKGLKSSSPRMSRRRSP